MPGILVSEQGFILPINQPIAIIGSEKEDISSFASKKTEQDNPVSEPVTIDSENEEKENQTETIKLQK